VIDARFILLHALHDAEHHLLDVSRQSTASAQKGLLMAPDTDE
jgi:hypothetical protein